VTSNELERGRNDALEIPIWNLTGMGRSDRCSRSATWRRPFDDPGRTAEARKPRRVAVAIRDLKNGVPILEEEPDLEVTDCDLKRSKVADCDLKGRTGPLPLGFVVEPLRVGFAYRLAVEETEELNRSQIPDDFAFLLTRKELTNLRCQIGISSCCGTATTKALTDTGHTISGPVSR